MCSDTSILIAQGLIHDDLTEALSTSLASPSHLPHPLPVPSPPRPSSVRTRHHRSSVSSVPGAVPPSPVLPSSASIAESTVSNSDSVAQKAAHRSSWTTGLWVWNKGKARQRKGSAGSVASVQQQQIPTGHRDGIGTRVTSGSARVNESAIIDEDEDESWRRGDGGSPPSFRAIFLATVSPP